MSGIDKACVTCYTIAMENTPQNPSQDPYSGDNLVSVGDVLHSDEVLGSLDGDPATIASVAANEAARLRAARILYFQGEVESTLETMHELNELDARGDDISQEALDEAYTVHRAAVERLSELRFSAEPKQGDTPS